ncbi:SIR2 family NAD-dependent protein deacylase [Herbaspirillum chlorophenolicum]|uniref:SIR2 family NAD-dependent protein deacylase n=1 Tax=Herbaspirillum chlorophenolicum TaxID=211589 RepID=UPI0009E29E7A|nr:Sir2 family NAD-dependent protein deacetylase [Herbaspirillum chlorophenolicum]
MGVDSGFPDFRGNEGFWKAYPPLAKTGITFSEIANGEAFVEDPVRSWGFYGHRLALYSETVPHAGFALLNKLAKTKPQGMFVFTSNVDGQFQKAGVSEGRIVECHGSIHHLQCSDDCTGAIWPVDAVAPPNILRFSDYRWNARRTDTQYSRMRAWVDIVRRPVVLELGAGTAVPSVRRIGECLGAPLVRINPREWLVKDADKAGLPCGALEGLKLLLS